LLDLEPFTGRYPYYKFFPFKYYENIIAQNLSIKQTALKNKNITVITPSKWIYKESKNSKLFGNFKHVLIPYGLDNKNVFIATEKTG
jgi:hypothetical protein